MRSAGASTWSATMAPALLTSRRWTSPPSDVTGQEAVAVAAPGQRHEPGLAVALEAPQVADDERLSPAPRSRCGRRRSGPGRGGGAAGAPARPRRSRAPLCSLPPAMGTEARWAAQVPSLRENQTVRPSGLTAGSAAPPPDLRVVRWRSTRPVSTETTTIRPSSSATNRAGMSPAASLWRFPDARSSSRLRSADPAGPPATTTVATRVRTATASGPPGARPAALLPIVPRPIPSCTPANLPPAVDPPGQGGRYPPAGAFRPPSPHPHLPSPPPRQHQVGRRPAAGPATSWCRRRPRPGRRGCSGS